MKTIKTLIVLILLTVSTVTTAQTNAVAIEKNDGTTDLYPLSEVDSIVYEPKIIITKYFYIGTTLPATEADITSGLYLDPADESFDDKYLNDGTHVYTGAYGIVDDDKTYDVNNRLYEANVPIYWNTAKNTYDYYVMWPVEKNFGIYGILPVLNIYTKLTNVTIGSVEYTVYTSNADSFSYSIY